MRFIVAILSLSIFLMADICSDIKANPNAFFSNPLNLASIDKNFKCGYMFENLQNLENTTMQIRGVSIDCDGNSAIEYQNSFKQLIAKALLAPEIYKRGLNDAKTSDEIVNKNRDYFQIWASESLYNFLKQGEFNSYYQVGVPMLVDYYKDEFGYDEASAIFYANRVANEYLGAAVGSRKDKFSFSELDKIMLNKNSDDNMLIEYLFVKKPDLSELNSALKIAILENRSIRFLEILLDYGAEINSGYESALFFSLKNLAIVKFLLQNGADINYKNAFGKTALFYAVEFKDENLVNLLIENGADVNAKIISSYQKMALVSTTGGLPFELCALNHTSKSLLMHAAKYSNLKIVKTLIKNGAKIDDIDDIGFNLADFAALNDDKNVLNYIRTLGINESKKTGDQDE
ncbi:ankyrin repeat domain-containing protein [Campylobacter geochelonis]|uniref:Ankyrin repeat-containing protein n=1 Tax=Campylobacter geochelonis TaxID=1780362 RepID=A0A128EI26_9BACT|nr:ankyrin repeat domain-containing protein [Campylobacter geochelonis]QKF71166.1 ankyrin domain-containing protein [Campylobacter geochelonis]CZE48221.1 ankyrin repeat-containing protein [Campylobacter geochelonis]CZE48528.1 ankyrin repeat-containing protein [Campylobacter geochelonis]CZE50025.1 ankyrin repeat-containing protein [Campylobacter geochelonis]